MNWKYISIDDSKIFEFHDSFFELDSVNGDSISIRVRALNISRNAEQNPKEYDLEIKTARITFVGVHDCTFDPGRTWKIDESGNGVPTTPEILYSGEDARKRITKELGNGIDVFSHTIFDGDHFSIEGSGIEPWFEVRFKAQRITVEWDEYIRPAWYEITRQYHKEMTLKTPGGRIMAVNAHVISHYDPDELYSVNSRDQITPKEINVGIKYEDREYWGRGTDPLGKDACENLQKQLPDGVKLQ